jgi:hypothetical protein
MGAADGSDDVHVDVGGHRHAPELKLLTILEGGDTRLEIWQCECGDLMEFRSTIPDVEE